MAISIRIYSDHQVFDETITDTYIVRSLTQDDQLNSGLDSSSSTRKFSLTKDCPYILPILSWNGKDDSNPPNEDSLDLHVLIADGNTPLFSGYLSDRISWGIDTHGADILTLTVEDNGTHLLKNPYTKDESALISGTFSQCLSSICTVAGITTASNIPTVSTNVSCVADGGETCESLLKDLCKEFGYAYYFEVDGKLNLKALSTDALSTTPIVNDTELYDSIQLSKRARQYRGSRIKWKKIGEKSNVLIYRDITKDDGAPSTADCWIKLNAAPASGSSYPANTPTAIKASDLAQGSEIYAILPSASDPTATSIVPTVQWDRGNGTHSIVQYGADSIKVICTCTSTGGFSQGIISKLQASARVAYIESTEIVYGNSDHTSENLYEAECRWIHDLAPAEKYANFCAQYWQYSGNTFTFKTKRDFALGEIIRLNDNVFTGLATYLMIQRIKSDGVSDVKTYEAVATSEFDYDKQTIVESMYTPPTEVYVEVPDVSQIVTDINDFRLNVRPSNLIADRRRTDTQEFNFSTVKKGYSDYPSTKITLKYWYGEEDEESAQTIVAASATVFLPYNHNHTSLIVTAKLTDDPETTTLAEKMVVLETIDETEEYVYYGQFNIDTEDYFDADGNIVTANYNQIDWTPLDAMLGANEQFVEGDCFFNNSTDGSFEDVYVYTWQNSHWIPINFSTFSNSIRSKICAQAQKDVLSTIQAGSVTKSDFGYFNTIIAGTVTADYIGSKEIEVQDGGFIYAGDVDITKPAGQRVGASGAGFCFDSIGNAEMSNIRITGDSTIEGGSTVLGTIINYDNDPNQPMPVFKTVKETSTTATLSGSKADGTDIPSAYFWPDFVNYLETQLSSGTDTATYQTTSPNTLNGYWGSSTIVSRTCTAFKYYSSAPSTTETLMVNVTGDQNSETSETKRIWTNPYPYSVTFKRIRALPKWMDNWAGSKSGCGYQQIYVSNRSTPIINTNYFESKYSADFEANAYDITIPPGGYITAYWGDSYHYTGGTQRGRGQVMCYFVEADNFSQGVNLVTSNGNRYKFDDVFPRYNDYQTYSQRFTCPNLSISIDIQPGQSSAATANWPIPKYYRFVYTQAPGSSTVTTSVFSSKSFLYDGVSKTVTSATFNNSMLKVTDSNGDTYEFYTATGYYYPQYSFSFVTLGESLGAYARSLLPTDDTNVHDIGASGTYASTRSQRWNTGFFTSLDVAQGIISQTINSGWMMPIITANQTLTEDFAVGAFRPYYVQSSGASGPTITMPGDSSQSYTVFSFRYSVAVVAGASCVARDVVAGGGTLSTSSYVSAAQPWCLLFVLRTA